jgi:2,3-bisphosphoglycerate-independent phosphoglycerate mutase
MEKKIVLLIMDGWGLAKNKLFSAVDLANTPFIDGCYKNYPNATLNATGLAVGLPEGQMGNSEVGHMNIGAGRVVYQNLAKINLAIADGSIETNAVLVAAFEKAKKENQKVHFIGLVSDGGVHSHINHLNALLSIAHTFNLQNIFVHAFTDGRDCSPTSGIKFIEELQNYLEKTNGKLASIVGRYWAMDRDKRWERIKICYDALVHSKGNCTQNALNEIQKSYHSGVSDEFLEPIILTDTNHNPLAKIEEGDLVINFNFRNDRPREITEALTQKDFPEFGMKKLMVDYLSMTSYDETYQKIKVLFNEDKLENTMGEVLANHNKKQIRIAETEKYPHVTFFFSGGREKPFEGESRILCPSPKEVATYDLKPEMAAYDIKNAIIPELEKQEVDFVCLNFANPDMVGHTGDFQACIKACEVVDECVAAVTKIALENTYEVIIIADHGNADVMRNEDTSINTQHSTNPVPFIFVTHDKNIQIKDGKLADIAPTILNRMNLAIPKEMTGKILITNK